MLLSEEIIKMAKSMELKQLLEAKKRSDLNDYSTKNRILSDLLNKNPSQFKIDSELNAKYVGITHTPTGFKIHAPRKLVPPGIEVKFNEAAKNKKYNGERSRQGSASQ